MASKTDICNSALIEAHIDTTISNIDEKSPNAERCKRIYDMTRRELLGMYFWSFANKGVNLARTDEDVQGYKYAYSYPSEALRINNIYSSRGEYLSRTGSALDETDAVVTTHKGNKCILCNYEAPFATINVDVTEEDIFPANFTRLFYLTMALKIAKMAGANKDIISEIEAQRVQELSVCFAFANRESFREEKKENYYVDVRG